MTTEIATRDGQAVQLNDAAVEALTLRGQVLHPDKEGYDGARTV